MVTELILIEPILLPMASGSLIPLGLACLIHTRLAARVVRPLLTIIVAAWAEETMRLFIATSRFLESLEVAALKEGVAIPCFALNLGHPIPMVQRMKIQDTRPGTVQAWEDVIIVTEPHQCL